MNNPEYILVDVFAEIVAATRVALGLPVLNYQYGYVTELNETLKQYSETAEYAVKKFPLVWLQQPFTVERGTVGFFGEVKDLRLFIMNASEINLKASERLAGNFKTVIYPI